jgi:hypothetical protein
MLGFELRSNRLKWGLICNFRNLNRGLIENIGAKI